MATHSSILAWKIPWTEDPGRLQSMGRRVGHDCATSLLHFTSRMGSVPPFVCSGSPSFSFSKWSFLFISPSKRLVSKLSHSAAGNVSI